MRGKRRKGLVEKGPLFIAFNSWVPFMYFYALSFDNMRCDCSNRWPLNVAWKTLSGFQFRWGTALHCNFLLCTERALHCTVRIEFHLTRLRCFQMFRQHTALCRAIMCHDQSRSLFILLMMRMTTIEEKRVEKCNLSYDCAFTAKRSNWMIELAKGAHL